MKVLVTGANGYIGRHVTKKLLDCGCQVVASDIRFDAKDTEALYREIDLFSEEGDLFTELGCPDVCIHLAWRNGFDHYNFTHVGDLPGHYAFLTGLIDAGLSQLVVMGTMHEVGYFEGAITEDAPTHPVTPYGIAKNALRELMEIYCAKKNTVLQWTRGYYILGDDARNNSIFSKMKEAEARGQELFPFTTGKNKFDFITVDELAAQIAAVAMQTEVKGIINCCSGRPVALAEQAEKFIRDNNMKIRLDYGKFPDRADASPAVWGDPEKINRIMAAAAGKK